jgi:hypothetical protein
VSTTYDVRQLTFREKLQSCSHVIVGVIDGVEDAQTEELPQGARAITVFRVKVIRVEFGASLPRVIAVRVVGGQSGGVTTPWTATMEPGQRMLFVLAPDHGARQNQFVPCFGAVYPVDTAGHFELDVTMASELRTLAGARARAKLTPRIVGTVAKSTRRTAVTPKAKLQIVEPDRTAAFPTDVPERQIRTAPAVKVSRKRARKRRP